MQDRDEMMRRLRRYTRKDVKETVVRLSSHGFVVPYYSHEV